jgi:ketosteroid isomerase-like protein
MCRASLVLAIAAIASACAEPPPAHAPVVPPPTREELAASVDSLYAHLVRAAESGDAPAYAASFAPAGAVLLPNRPAIAGRPALTAWAAEFFATWEVRIDTLAFEDRETGPAVGFARYRARGRYVPRAGGPTVAFDQKYIDTFVRDSTGTWLLAAHMVNSNVKARSVWD